MLGAVKNAPVEVRVLREGVIGHVELRSRYIAIRRNRITPSRSTRPVHAGKLPKRGVCMTYS